MLQGYVLDNLEVLQNAEETLGILQTSIELEVVGLFKKLNNFRKEKDPDSGQNWIGIRHKF